jgi:GNAT superfamily N-acetyltransferase
MPDFKIASYQGEDFEPVVSLLQSALIADTISPPLFTRKVLLDPNFSPDGALVAKIGDEVVGFLLAIARRNILEDGPDDRDRGWIPLFAVSDTHRRRGIGRELLGAGTAYLRSMGCKTVLVSPYAPNYWTPGVDVAAYAGAVAFLELSGFASVYRPISMQASLEGDWCIPEWARDREARLISEGFRLEGFTPNQIPALSAFLRSEFPGDWQRYVRETMTVIVLGRREASDLTIAYDGEHVVGFAQHEGERFGPFGVAASQRGRGMGAVLMFRTLETMRQKGLKNAWFLWTDDATAQRVYHAAGFQETRRYAVMKQEL